MRMKNKRKNKGKNKMTNATTPKSTSYTGTVNGKVWKNCHTGNTALFKVTDGGTLYAGGWSRGANPGNDWVVIDLADGMRDSQDIEDMTGGLFPSVKKIEQKQLVLKLYLPDYGVPDFPASFWVDFAQDVLRILQGGKNVLIACTGGHGRTGLVGAILAGICYKEAQADAIAWIRKVHCQEAVETIEQEYYVDGVINFACNGGPEDFFMPPKKSYTSGAWDYSERGNYGKPATTKKFDDKGNTIAEYTDPWEEGNWQQPATNRGHSATASIEDAEESDDETARYLAWLNENSGG